MKKKITFDIMKTISNNLMIYMSDEEIEIIMKQVENCIDELDKLTIFKNNDYDIENTRALNFPKINVDNKFREDEVIEFDNKEELLNNASEIKNRLIKV